MIHIQPFGNKANSSILTKVRPIFLGLILIVSANKSIAQNNNQIDSIRIILEASLKRSISYRDSLFSYYFTKVGSESAETRNFVRKMSKYDSAHLKVVESIIRQFGWPSSLTYGSEASQSAFIAIQHSGSLVVLEKYMPLLIRQAKQGHVDWRNVALMDDRLNISKKKEQKYGTQFHKLEKDSSVIFVLFPIDKIKKVNKRRKSIGLEELAEFMASNQIAYIEENFE